MSGLIEKREYYEDRTLKSIYFVDENGNKQGKYQEYDSSGNLVVKAKYKDNRFHGAYVNKETGVEIRYEDGLMCHYKDKETEIDTDGSVSYQDIISEKLSMNYDYKEVELPCEHGWWDGSPFHRRGCRVCYKVVKENYDQGKVVYRKIKGNKWHSKSRDDCDFYPYYAEMRSDGPCIEYDGIEFRTYRYNRKSGKIDGFFKELNVHGNVVRTSEYKDGKLNGKTVIYNIDGTIKQESGYKDGKLHGKSITYNNDGTILKEETYRDGVDITAEANRIKRLREIAKGNVSEEKGVIMPKRSKLDKVTAMLKDRLSGNSGQ